MNWCPKDKTVLANEQVVGGLCERCDTAVTQKEVEQWMFKITDYASRLLDDIEGLDWPEATKLAQKNWIGRSEGALIKFEIRNPKSETNPKSQIPNSKQFIEVFTTRPDTLFGATYAVLGPEHQLIQSLKLKIQNWPEVEKYISKARVKTDKDRIAEGREKTGVELKGIKAVNPANNEEISVWVADYVLGNVGTGAIMAVPAHDDRDFEFAKKYKLPVRQVISPKFVDFDRPPRPEKRVVHRRVIHAIVRRPSDNKILMLQWKGDMWGSKPPRTFIIGGIEEGEDPIESAKREIREETGYRNVHFIKKLNIEVHTEYFAAHKDENRYGKINIICFELNSEEQDPVSSEETGKHDPVWISEKEVTSFINVVDGPFIWNWCKEGDKAYAGDGVLINSGKFDGMVSENAKSGIIKFVGGVKRVQCRLHDWVLSRQRYWGVPIPMVKCDKCGYVSVPEKDLPVKLPPLKDFKPSDDGRSPLARAKKWADVKCHKCGGTAERETDTMDTFVDSSWYFLRYADPKNEKEFASRERMNQWLPVPMYVGGAEHNTMHLLYSRFFTKAPYDLGFVNFGDPFTGRRNHGTILGPDGQKMSKSRGNAVDPDKEVAKFGADAVRMYLAFMGPYGQGGPWSPGGITGVYRFLNRVWNFTNAKLKILNDEKAKHSAFGIRHSALEKLIYKTVKKVTEDIDNLRFNTAISALMILLNEFEKNKEAVTTDDVYIFLRLLSPFAPYLTEELWKTNGLNKAYKTKNGSIHETEWPKFDADMIKDETIELVIQINGKMRGKVSVLTDIDEESAKKAAVELDGMKKYLSTGVKKTIFVKGKLINFVV